MIEKYRGEIMKNCLPEIREAVLFLNNSSENRLFSYLICKDSWK